MLTTRCGKLTHPTVTGSKGSFQPVRRQLRSVFGALSWTAESLYNGRELLRDPFSMQNKVIRGFETQILFLATFIFSEKIFSHTSIQ